MNTITPKISILVPIYKVEAYLQRCIDSVLSQSFQDWEMILVDDGSPDRCPQICDEAAAKDERISVVHKPNGGLVSARKAGVAVAKGEYYVFLDSDDWLMPDALSRCYMDISCGWDMVRYNPMRVTDKGNENIETYPFDNGIVTTNQEYLELWFNDKTAPYLHSCIFKASLFTLDVFDILIENNITFVEDGMTLNLISHRINKVKFIKEPVAYYFKNTSSMVMTMERSFEYADLLRKLTIDYCDSFIPASAKYDRDKKNAYSDLGKFFIPEIHYDKSRFLRISQYIVNDKWKSPYNRWPKSYYLFVWSEPLFHLYTTVYRLMIFVIKRKCRSRKLV